ncbi:MAG: 2,3-cyclic 3-phosphodiesterase [Acidobacteriaceae bacterium]|jgi:2'-5' RNA ligase|nr:2,3-cyclic 3-phosphodiesterase [Acidobacteriaceae bacterium]
MRLFVALEIPPAIRENLAAIRENFSSIGPKLRWVPTENLHVTLKFIGSVPAEKLEAIIDALRRVRADKSVKLDFIGYGGIAAGVYWATIEPCPALEKLAADIDRCLEPLGIAKENRAFHPHVTVARFKDRGILEKINDLIHENAIHGDGRYLKCEFGSMTPAEFHLMESTTVPTGAIYSKVESFPLAAALPGN